MKFNNLTLTAEGKARAFIEAKNLKTLWFNTGTLCNLTCKNCYIESSPTNDRLSYLSFDEYLKFMIEAKEEGLNLLEIGFTGGEPFLNKDFPKMLNHSVQQDVEVLVLTNAMKPMLNKRSEILNLNKDKLTFRISIDHVDEKKHEKITDSKLVLLKKGSKLKVKSLIKSNFLLISGKPIGEKIARGGPFVMNTKAEILEAINDYHNGTFVK